MKWIQDASVAYRIYKADGGTMGWNRFLAVLKEASEDLGGNSS